MSKRIFIAFGHNNYKLGSSFNASVRDTFIQESKKLGYEIDLDDSDAVCLPLKAGSIAVFSSLTPHRTGPNMSENIRKSYILQYAPDGSERKISHSLSEPVNDKSRQFLILKDGKRA